MVCEMVTEDEKAAFGYAQCRLPSVKQFLLKGMGKMWLCSYHEEEFEEEIRCPV